MQLSQAIAEIKLWKANISLKNYTSVIDDLFIEYPELPACLILSGNEIEGMILRSQFLEKLSRPFVRELYINKDIDKLFFLNVINTEPLIIFADTLVQTAIDLSLNRKQEAVHHPVVINNNNEYFLANIEDLLRIQSNFLKDTIHSKEKLILDAQNTASELRKLSEKLLASEEHLEGEVLKRTLELENVNANLLSKQNQIEQELTVARTLQQSILPSSFPNHPAFNGHSFMRAARMIGGDFFDVLTLDENRIGLLVGDISGKGVPAALFMVLVRSVLQEIIRNEQDPATSLSQANLAIEKNNPLSLFITLIYGVLDLRTGIFKFCNAGHLMPYILRKNGHIDVFSERGSPLLGLIESAKYVNHSIELNSGDGLLLISDGVTECFNNKNEAYGETRLLDLIEKIHHYPSEKIIKEIDQSLIDFSTGIDSSDDITAMMIRFTGAPSLLTHYDFEITAYDRHGLLRDISEVFAKEMINVIGVRTESIEGIAQMIFNIETSDVFKLKKIQSILNTVQSIISSSVK